MRELRTPWRSEDQGLLLLGLAGLAVEQKSLVKAAIEAGVDNVTVQGGIVDRSRVHDHTIWRDKIADYGAEYISR